MRKRTLYIAGGILALAALAIVSAIFFSKQHDAASDVAAQSNQNHQVTNAVLSVADQDGVALSNGHCTGTEKPLLTHLPMNIDDFSMILPYGLMTGGHVTPVDHQYFSPADFQSAPDTYPVYAMADSRIVDIGTRQHAGFGAYADQSVTDYRIVFMVSCRLLYYYDLVTSLTPDIAAAFAASGHVVDIPVTAGQQIGSIGGQTLDFAVWDMDSRLTGFVVPEQYIGEPWKIHTVDPLLYYTDDLKAQALSKYIRTQEPRSGMIDYDVDGTLMGTWFQQGTNGYVDPASGGGTYWTGHLSFAPDYIDPTAITISVGNWPDGASQFAVIGNTPDPATVTPASGMVKYDLARITYTTDNGFWDRTSLVTPIHMVAEQGNEGCMLAQLLDARIAKVEAFAGTACSAVSDFTDAAVLYER